MVDRLSAADPTTDKVERLLGFCGRMHAAGDLAVAAGLCRRAHMLAPEDTRPLVELGAIMLELGQHRDGVAVYRKALSIDPDNLEALIGLGKAHLALKQPDEAERQFQTALRLNDTDYRSYNGLGVLKDLRGDHAKAQSYYRTGLVLAPEATSLRSNLGLSLSLTGRHQEAVAILGDLAEDYDSDATNRQNLALAHARAGDMRNAEQVARLDLEADAVATNLDYFAAERLALAKSQRAAARVHMPIVNIRPVVPHSRAFVEHGVPPVVLFPMGSAAAVQSAAKPAPAGQAKRRAVSNAPMPVASTALVDEDGVAVGPETAISTIASSGEAQPVQPSMPVAQATLVDEDGADIGAIPSVTFETAILDALTLPAGGYEIPSPPAQMAQSDKSEPRVVSAASAGQFAVQLGSYRNLALAAAELARKQTDLTGLIDRGALKIESAKLNGDDVRYRLKVSGIASRTSADALCDRVRQQGSACMVSGPPASRQVAAAAKAAVSGAQSIDAKPRSAATRRARSGSSFSVQLGAFRQSASLEKELQRLRRAAPKLLGQQEIRVQKSMVDGQQLLRLRTVQLADEQAARTLCRSLKAAGIGCVIAIDG
jgi:Flp pilus assembly protein TadD